MRKRRMTLDDAHSTTELRLFAENDQPTYRQGQAIETNLAKKVCKGVFVTARAEVAFKHLADAAGKKYQREYGDASQPFPIAARKALAKELAHEFAARVRGCRRGEQGDCNDLAPGALAALKKSSCSTAELGRARRRR